MESLPNLSRAELLPLILNHPTTHPKDEGEWLMFFCPVPRHNDGAKHGYRSGRSGGLSSKGVMKCWNNCTFSEMLKALGYQQPREEKPMPTPAARAATNPPGTTYDYKDEQGALVAVKGRWDNPDGTKRFAWRMPEAADWNGLRSLSIEQVPLFGAEDVAGWGMDEWIVFTEGEKARDACRNAGLNAVCHGGGASTRKFGTSLDVLAGRKVALWADNDEVGRKFMLAVQKQLKLVAHAIFMIVAPVPPKGDAWDYFNAGGKADDLFNGRFDKPVAQLLTSDHIKVIVPTELGNVNFDFDMIEHYGRELTCHLTVSTADLTGEPYGLRMDLLSQSKREVLERSLRRQFGEANWTLAVSQAYARCLDIFLNQDRAIDLSQVAEPSDMDWLLDGLIPKGQPTIIFADGENGKSWICYAMAIAVASGQPLLGMATAKTGVLIVDYETDEKQARLRIGRLLRGFSLTKGELPHYWWSKGVPLAEQVEALKRFIRDNDIGLVVVDSGAPACGSQPEDAKSTVAFFNALAKLDATSLIICHTNRVDAVNKSADRPFGCHDEETEVLTRRGWFRHAALLDTDEVAAYDTEKRELRWERPSVRHRYQFDGEMVAIRGASLDLRVTPNHRMWVRPAWQADWRETTAGALSGTTVALPYASGLAEVEGPDADPAWLAYLGWWIAEGHLDGNVPLLTQAEGPLATRFVETTEALGFTATIVRPRPRDGEKQCWQVRACGASEFGKWLRDECGTGAANKQLPNIVWTLNRASLRLLLFALMEGDGHWNNEGRGSYTTTSPRLADDVQRLAILAGFSARVRNEGRAASHHRDRYSVLIGSRREIEVRESRHLSREEYHGFVYCLTVPSGAYVTRRNGYMAVTMNSTFWHNMARRTYFCASNKPSGDQIDIALICKKANEGRRPAPFAFKVTFSGKEGTGDVMIEPQNIRDVDAFRSFLPTIERVWEMLRANGDMLFHQIMKELTWSGDDRASRLRKVLQWGRSNGWFEEVQDQNQQIHWRALSRLDQRP